MKMERISSLLASIICYQTSISIISRSNVKFSNLQIRFFDYVSKDSLRKVSYSNFYRVILLFEVSHQMNEIIHF